MDGEIVVRVKIVSWQAHKETNQAKNGLPCLIAFVRPFSVILGWVGISDNQLLLSFVGGVGDDEV